MPLISVIMGVYNTPYEYLEKSINSVLNQTVSNFEFIIVDDGSNEICRNQLISFSKKDSRIILLINEKNMGLTYSLNRGISVSTGKYIARMDSDDYNSLDRFEKQLEYFKDNPDADMVSTDVYLFDSNGVWGERCWPHIIKKKDFLKTSPVTHPTIMVEKEKLKKINFYLDIKRTIRCEDFDLFARFVASGQSIHTLNKKLYYFREDIDSANRRKFKYRINGAKTSFVCFKQLKILFPLGWIYIIRGLIIGLLPKWLYIRLKRTKEKKN